VPGANPNSYWIGFEWDNGSATVRRFPEGFIVE
jgi:hypothetical protein